MSRTALRICPLCGGHLRADPHHRGHPRHRRPRRPGRRLQQGDSSAPRAPPSVPSTATPTGCAPRSSASTAPCARPPGKRPSTRSPPACARVVERYGPDAVGVVLGNPNVHTMAGGSTRRSCSAPCAPAACSPPLTVDQMPKHVSSGLLFGDAYAIPCRTLDHTDHLLLIGANPLESNAAVCAPPRLPRPAQGAQGPRRPAHRRGPAPAPAPPSSPTGTWRSAPVPTPCLLAAMAHTLFAEDLVDLGHLAPHVQGLDELHDALGDFTPEAVAPACDLDAGVVRTLGPGPRRSPPPAAVYARIGSCTRAARHLASWLVDVLNILTGNLDRPGGALFPQAATDRTPRPAGPGRGFALGRWHSRVSKHPEAKGELPLAALAEEIDTPTDEGRPGARADRRRRQPGALAPDGDRLDKALASLDFMVSVDPYLNETSRHAHVVLPPPPALPEPAPRLRLQRPRRAQPGPLHPPRGAAGARPHGGERDPRPAGAGRHGWVSLFERGREPGECTAPTPPPSTRWSSTRPSARPSRTRTRRCTAATRRDLAAQLTGDDGAERRLDLMLRLGPYGDGFGARPDGLSLARLLDRPHGIDLGPLRPRLPQPLKTRSGKVELLPEPIAGDLPRLRPGPARAPRRPAPGRPPPSALQQQLDAQRARPHRRQQPLHRAHPPRGPPGSASGTAWTYASRAPGRG